MNNGGTIDVWTRYNQDGYQDPNGPGPYGLITQANYLWEFVPSDPSLGTTITQNAGELINRQSGLCLDVANNNTSDGATMDQWACNGGANQQWMAIPVNGSYYLMPVLDIAQLTEPGAGTPSLGVGNGSTCTTSGDGDSVYARTTGTTGNPCDEWDIQQASYDFATHPITVGGPILNYENDNRSYECVQGDHVRPDAAFETWDYYDLSQSGARAALSAGSYNPPSYVPGGSLSYEKTTVTGSPVGQVMLYCDPSTTTP